MMLHARCPPLASLRLLSAERWRQLEAALPEPPRPAAGPQGIELPVGVMDSGSSLSDESEADPRQVRGGSQSFRLRWPGLGFTYITFTLRNIFYRRDEYFFLTMRKFL